MREWRRKEERGYGDDTNVLEKGFVLGTQLTGNCSDATRTTVLCPVRIYWTRRRGRDEGFIEALKYLQNCYIGLVLKKKKIIIYSQKYRFL